MTFNTTNPNELAQLGLVASDMAYKGGAAVVGESLAPYFDPVVMGPDHDITGHGFKVLRGFQDPGTGFKAVIFENTVTKELVISFAGVDGPNVKDWWASVNHVGWNQWERNRADILNLIRPFISDPTYKFHFTGQSLGGALAQYASYEFLNGMQEAQRSRVTLTTFNGLGGLDGLKQNVASFDPTVFDDIAQGRHYQITNDLVSRLGSGFVGGETYELRYANPNKLAPNGQPYKYGIVEGHRIESGFYANLNPTTHYFQFGQTTQQPSLIIPNLQILASGFGNVLRRQGTNTVAAAFDLFAATLYGIVRAPGNEVNRLAWALVEHAHASGHLADKTANYLYSRDWGLTMKLWTGFVIAASPLKFITTFVGSTIFRGRVCLRRHDE